MTRLAPVAAFLLATAAAPAAGCPVCGGETGRQVREGIADGDFGRNALATALPFAAVVAVAALIHFAPRSGLRRGRKQ